MKRLGTFLALLFTVSLLSAHPFKLSDKAVDNTIASSEDVTMNFFAGTTNNFGDVNFVEGAEAKTVGGFLLRSFFCGSIALHRYYMGTSGESLWWKYLCIPVVGGVANCVDFWWVVFKGDTALREYENNGKYLVWTD